jgi:hypothetical protein
VILDQNMRLVQELEKEVGLVSPPSRPRWQRFRQLFRHPRGVVDIGANNRTFSVPATPSPGSNEPSPSISARDSSAKTPNEPHGMARGQATIMIAMPCPPLARSSQSNLSPSATLPPVSVARGLLPSQVTPQPENLPYLEIGIADVLVPLLGES